MILNTYSTFLLAFLFLSYTFFFFKYSAHFDPCPIKAVCTEGVQNPLICTWACSCRHCWTNPHLNNWKLSSCQLGTWRLLAPTRRLRWGTVTNLATYLHAHFYTYKSYKGIIHFSRFCRNFVTASSLLLHYVDSIL